MQFRASEFYARDNVKGLAYTCRTALASGLPLEDIEIWSDIVKRVMREDIIKVAKVLFVNERSLTGWLMKDKGDAE